MFFNIFKTNSWSCLNQFAQIKMIIQKCSSSDPSLYFQMFFCGKSIVHLFNRMTVNCLLITCHLQSRFCVLLPHSYFSSNKCRSAHTLLICNNCSETLHPSKTDEILLFCCFLKPHKQNNTRTFLSTTSVCDSAQLWLWSYHQTQPSNVYIYI